MKSFSKKVVSKDEKRTFSITLSRKMMEVAGNKSFWPSSATVTGHGRLRTVTVDKDETDDLLALVDRYGGGLQEE